MTDLQTLVTAIALALLGAVGVAIGTGRSVAERIGRGLAVCAVILLILVLAWPG
jgi:uncharacterized membrane protein